MARDDEVLRDAVGAIARVVDAGGRDEMAEDRLRERLRLFQRLEGLATTGLADTVSALARTGAVDDDGASSRTDWVKAQTGRSGRDAARLSRLSTDLGELPATRRALASGRITAEAADAVTRAARDGRLGSPEQVDQLLAPIAADSSPEVLRADIRDRQQAVEGAAMLRDENRQHARRSTRLWRKDSGMWGLSGELPDELGQTVRTALDAFDHPDPPDTPFESGRRPEQRLADALALMAGSALDHGVTPATGGVARPHLSVIVPADTVSAELSTSAVADGVARSGAPARDDPRWAELAPGELPWGGKLSPQAVRRICCDAAVSRVVMAGDSQGLDVGRATRQWSGAQRRAVNARDRGCRGPHCSRPSGWTSIHHLQWWSEGGPTSVDNGLALCHSCHRRVHDQGWTVELDVATAAATWTSPTGRTIVTRPDGSCSAATAGPGEPAGAVGPVDPAGGPGGDRGETDGVAGPDDPDPGRRSLEHATAGNRRASPSRAQPATEPRLTDADAPESVETDPAVEADVAVAAHEAGAEVNAAVEADVAVAADQLRAEGNAAVEADAVEAGGNPRP